MKEGDPAVTDPAPGLLVDQPEPAGAALLESHVHVGTAIGGVVEPRTALGEEAPDRRVVAQRLKQFDVRVADAQKRGLHALVGDGLAVLQRHSETLRVERDRGIEIFDGDPDVIDCLEHGEAV
jgi:hypothetical protein